MALAIDTTILPLRSVMFARKSLSRSGGQTLNGTEQVVQSSTDFWEAIIQFKIATLAQRLYYRSLQAQNFGRAGEWIISACVPFPGVIPPIDFSFSSDFSSDFSLGSSAPTSIPSGAAAVVDTVGAVMGDRTLNVHMLQNVVPLPGMYFSIGDRLYCIGTVTPITGVRAYTFTFAPGLRADIPDPGVSQTALEFSNPRCLMRLAEDNIGQMNLDFLRFANITLHFVEVPTT